jgi:hypothetical protein
MTNLEKHQRGVLALIKERPPDFPPDDWLRRIAGSRELEMLREIALWWRGFQVSSQCRFTSRLLKQLRIFETEIAAFYGSRATAPFIDQLAREFLGNLVDHPDPLVRSLAATELAMFELRRPEPVSKEIVWDRNPEQVFAALDRWEPVPDEDASYLYLLKLDREFPQLAKCVRVERTT